MNELTNILNVAGSGILIVFSGLTLIALAIYLFNLFSPALFNAALFTAALLSVWNH